MLVSFYQGTVGYEETIKEAAERILEATNPNNKNLENSPATTKEGSMEKTLHNSDVSGAKENVKDIVVFGNGDMFQLLCKASSKAEGWMKSTKAMEIPDRGCVVQVTTQQGDNVSEALTFVPGVRIESLFDENCKVIGRHLKAL